MLLKSPTLDSRDIESITAAVSRETYGGNITAETRDDGWHSGKRWTRFTLGVRDSRAFGARRSASGRHMPKASWEAHRDVMRAIFFRDPDAVLITGLITYRGRDDFGRNFEATGWRNVGSAYRPIAMRDTSVGA